MNQININPISPLTHSRNVKLLKRIPTNKIIELYKNILSIDVQIYFSEFNEISLYECLDSGLKFFEPIDLMGESKFYEELQIFDWYYMDWKWEQQLVYKKFLPNDKILEIGSGRGGFLKLVHDNGFNITGLELNKSTVDKAKEWNCRILNETIQEHSKLNTQKYDTVCSFQVMEHIPQLKEVLDSSIQCLKKGGRLFISVPNNDSFIGKDDENFLNMPPHHCTLWNKKTFESIADIFSLEIMNIFIEPLQDYHIQYYHTVKKRKLQKSYQKLYYHIFERLFFPILVNWKFLIPGFSIIGEFKKK